MTHTAFYQTAQTVPVKTIRDDIVRSINTVFPSFRAFPKVSNLCTDEYEDIVFITETNALAYVKVLGCGRTEDVRSLCADRQMVERRWQRACDRAGVLVTPVELIVVVETCASHFLSALSVECDVPCSVYTVRMIVNAVGGFAYVFDACDSCVSQDESAPDAYRAVVESVLPEPATIETLPKEDLPSSDDSGTRDTVSTCTQKLEADAQSLSQATVVVPESCGDDFFTRSQLSEEEEREFFLLNKQLSEYEDGR